MHGHQQYTVPGIAEADIKNKNKETRLVQAPIHL